MNRRLVSPPAALCLLVTLLSSWASHAQGIEPWRYVNSQGVEMFMSRSAPRPTAAPLDAAQTPAANVADAPVVGPSTPSQRARTGAAAGTVAAATTAAVAMRNEMRIRPAQQALRDEERERVLNTELLDEGNKLEVKRKALRSPRTQIDLDATQRAKLATDVQRHEENIRALTRELALLRPARTKQQDH